MYTLSFPTSSRFEILYEALTVSTGFSGGELRIVNSLFTKLEKISELKTDEDGLRGLRTLTNIDKVLVLENAEFELLKRAFNNVTWTAQGARLASDVYDYLQNLHMDN